MRAALLLLVLLAAPPALADGGEGEPRTWHRLIGILQYLQADYPAAVESQSAFELAEQKSFAAEALQATRELGPAGAPFLARVASVAERVNRSVAPQEVSALCGTLVAELVATGGLARSPRQAPDLVDGARIYAEACAACHAENGSAQVAIAKDMEPAPASFLDAETMRGLSPYKAFNTISFGVPGTAMPGYPGLTEVERWSLAFFVFTMRQPACDHTPPRASLERLATATDAELVRDFGEKELACLRRKIPDMDDEQSLLTARQGVNDALRYAEQGKLGAARQSLTDAYLNGLEPVEPLLRGRSPALIQQLEESFMRARVAAERDPAALRAEGKKLIGLLDLARQSSGSTTGTLSVMWLTMLILLREGFEATIIVGAILAMLHKLGARAQARLVHLGWMSALVVGAAAFFFGRHLMQGAHRELLEGCAALFSVVMLLYAALWLNARSQLSRFMGELREKMKGSLGGGSTAGLFTIAFTAVLRESFETALFLQGLTLDSPRGVAWGTVGGVVLLLGFVIFVKKVGFRLPMKTLFKASTVLLVVTAVILLGKGLHALQEVGYVPLEPVPFITLDFLGLYPDAVSLLPQLLLALAPLVYWLLRRNRGAPRATAAASGR